VIPDAAKPARLRRNDATGFVRSSPLPTLLRTKRNPLHFVHKDTLRATGTRLSSLAYTNLTSCFEIAGTGGGF